MPSRKFNVLKALPFWNKGKKNGEEEQGDLFEYAYQEQKRIKKEGTSQAESYSQKEAGRKKKFLFLPLFLLFSMAAGFAGAYVVEKKDSECEIERKAFIYPFRRKRQLSYIQKLEDGRLHLARSEEKKDPHYDPFGNQGPYIDLDKVRRIDLFPPLAKKESSPSRELRTEEKRFLGRYRMQVSQHRGLFYIYRSKRGGLGASVRFTNWGKQRMEFLGSVRVWKNKIYFSRSCRGKRCSEIGSGRILNQKFEGSLSRNRKQILGTYTGGQSGSRWRAIRY